MNTSDLFVKAKSKNLLEIMLQIDFSKAFNSISFEFIENTLKLYNFNTINKMDQNTAHKLSIHYHGQQRSHTLNQSRQRLQARGPHSRLPIYSRNVTTEA